MKKSILTKAIKSVIQNGLVTIFAIAISLLLSECGARLLLNPADYLSAATIRDDILGIRIASGSKGFDEWGFRNPNVPRTADIVALGDSHTYGNNATMSESWPSVVQKITGETVYNLGLGGYGPNQYHRLLMTRGIQLRPKWVVCGLYFGDDFENSFTMTYGRDYWSFLRTGHWSNVDANIWETADATSWHRRVRVWLSENSVLYRVVVHGPVLGKLKGLVQIRRAERQQDPAVATLRVPGSHIYEAFRPLGLRQRLDQQSAAVREGMRITFDLLTRMNQTCKENGCRFAVVLIPTKETVFADDLLRDQQNRLRDAIEDLVRDERAAKTELLGYLNEQHILSIDTLPALKAKRAEQLDTRSDGDMHPNANGYKVIGETVAGFLRSSAAMSVEDGHR